jgi:Fe-S-cluster containining protein
MECLRCGTCCTAPDIKSLEKPQGVRCDHLLDTMLCAIYDERPAVCRSYRPDEICLEVAAPTLTERTGRYLKLFGS